MSKSEHRVSVENGKYTFVVPADDYRVSILRYGEPWHGPQGEASNALHQIMMELDAARAVVQVVRRHVEAPVNGVPDDVIAALRLHDSLVSDREPPSAWTGATPGEDLAHLAPQPPDVMPMIDGKSFRCECGANVFRHPPGEPLIYVCNACRARYRGEPLTSETRP